MRRRSWSTHWNPGNPSGLYCSGAPPHPKQHKHSAPQIYTNVSTGSLRSHLNRRGSSCLVTFVTHLYHGQRPRPVSGQAKPVGTCQGTKPICTLMLPCSGLCPSTDGTTIYTELYLSCCKCDGNTLGCGRSSEYQSVSLARAPGPRHQLGRQLPGTPFYVATSSLVLSLTSILTLTLFNICNYVWMFIKCIGDHIFRELYLKLNFCFIWHLFLSFSFPFLHMSVWL